MKGCQENRCESEANLQMHACQMFGIRSLLVLRYYFTFSVIVGQLIRTSEVHRPLVKMLKVKKAKDSVTYLIGVACTTFRKRDFSGEKCDHFSMR